MQLSEIGQLTNEKKKVLGNRVHLTSQEKTYQTSSNQEKLDEIGERLKTPPRKPLIQLT